MNLWSSEVKNEAVQAPSPRKLARARAEGFISQSAELMGSAGLLAGFFLLYFFAASWLAYIASVMKTSFGTLFFDPNSIYLLPQQLLQQTVLWLFLIFTLTLLPRLLMGGWVFASLRFHRLAQHGGQNLTARHFILVLAKITIALPLVVVLAYKLHKQSVGAGLRSSVENLYLNFLVLGALLVVLALMDAAWAIYRHRQSLFMTRQEVLDELKEEGGAQRPKSNA